MSSYLCKKVEGAVFPFQVESLEDRVDDAVHAFYVDEADHGPGSSAHFHEAALDDVGAFLVWLGRSESLASSMLWVPDT
jgi:hypothetical protein